MIRENIGRRSILKGIGAVVGNPLGLFKKAAVATATELTANVVKTNVSDQRKITKCTVDMIPGIMQSYIYGQFEIPVVRLRIEHPNPNVEMTKGVLEYENDDSGETIYLDTNDIGANIAQYFKNDFGKLIQNTVGSEGLYSMNEAFGGVFSKLFTNAANYMGPQNLAKAIIDIYKGSNGTLDIRGGDVEMVLAALQDMAQFSNTMEKIFNPDDLNVFRDFDCNQESDMMKIKNYFKKRGVDFETVDHSIKRKGDQSEDPSTKTKAIGHDMSDDDWMATTHGGYEPGRSGGYSKDRMFESANIRIIASLITEDPDIFISEA
jgi:hypothetical protein